jgi:hypothetical protein
MRAGAVHLAKRLIGDGTGFILEQDAVFGQHRGVSTANCSDPDNPM